MGGQRRRGRHWVRWLDGITDAMDMNLGKLWETVGDRKAWHPAAQGLWTVGHDGQLSKDKELCFCCLPNSLPRCNVFRQLKTSDRLQKQLPDWERYSPVTTKCHLRLLLGYTASHFRKHGARPSWNFTLCLFLFKMSLSVHLNKPPLQTYIYMGRENRKRAEHMFTPQTTALTIALESWEKGSFACPSQGPLSFSIKPGRENCRLAPQQTSVVQWSMWTPLSTSHSGNFRRSLPHSALMESIFPFPREGIWGMFS